MRRCRDLRCGCHLMLIVVSTVTHGRSWTRKSNKNCSDLIKMTDLCSVLQWSLIYLITVKLWRFKAGYIYPDVKVVSAMETVASTPQCGLPTNTESRNLAFRLSLLYDTHTHTHTHKHTHTHTHTHTHRKLSSRLQQCYIFTRTPTYLSFCLRYLTWPIQQPLAWVYVRPMSD